MTAFLFLLCCFAAASAEPVKDNTSCCGGVGKNVQKWFQKLGSLSDEIAASCSNLPEADKVNALEVEIRGVEQGCKKNASFVAQFATETEMKLKELEEKIEKLQQQQASMVLTKKLQNGVLEKMGDVCNLRCIPGTYAFPGKNFSCKESDYCAEARCVPVTSCKEIKKLMPVAKSGVYAIIRKDGGPSYNVYCDMTTDGGGWTLAANIANGDSNNWIFGDKDRDFGDSASLWENDMTLGTVDNATINRPQDFKSRAFLEVDSRELLITYKGKRYIQTDGNCLGGISLKRLFNVLRFSCAGSSYNCYYGKCMGTGCNSASSRCDHSCDIAKFYPPSVTSSEPLSNGKMPSKVLMKTGEAEGAQDGNKDRVYISTLPSRNSVDYVNGLGSFTSLSGNIKKTDISVHDDVSKESSDRTLFYGLFVR
ncbi:uncharacterized protein LOC135684690 [Rhopilema esculentum]|uniref:uncharacterized protein LOC135684690 n=1 Tax=Rhopilema esculentum TaxID=499914 RepID=UPI0031DCDF77